MVYQIIDYNKFLNLIKNTNWSEILQLTDVNAAANLFVTQFKTLLNSCKTKKENKHKVKKIKEWISTELIIAIRKRDKLKKNLAKNVNTQLINEYKEYRNYVNDLIKKTKFDYYKNQITRNRNNTKKFYQIIEDATNKGESKKSEINIVNNNNETFVEQCWK